MRQTYLSGRLRHAAQALLALPPWHVHGSVVATSGLGVDVAGLSQLLSIGDRVVLRGRNGAKASAEIISFGLYGARAMAFATLDGLGPGGQVTVNPNQIGKGGSLGVTDAWLGRVIDPLGRPLDGMGALPQSTLRRQIRVAAPEATLRARLGPRLETGVRVLDAFTTTREGQRLGLFAGSGVGKSTLLSMLARHTACDIAVLALVGERGREVREFLEDDLGTEGLARSVVVIATSDTPPLMRREAAYTAMTIAEHFRDQGKSVLLMVDSVTRFCLALREIGLSAGEPPATRGYPPSVFAELPRLLERAGPGFVPSAGQQGCQTDGKAGQITGLFTVLVEGDDMNEPVADAARGILDGHVVMSRSIGEGGRYPAVDVLRSLSRTVPGCNSAEENALTQRARALLAIHANMGDLIRLGAYRTGSDPDIDEAIRAAPLLDNFLRQERDDRSDLNTTFLALRMALDSTNAA